MGENDAWQVAIAEQMGAVLVGHDAAAFHRLGAGYEDHHRA
jgi:predicted nucleic acid-binding protein